MSHFFLITPVNENGGKFLELVTHLYSFLLPINL